MFSYKIKLKPTAKQESTMFTFSWVARKYYNLYIDIFNKAREGNFNNWFKDMLDMNENYVSMSKKYNTLILKPKHLNDLFETLHYQGDLTDEFLTIPNTSFIKNNILRNNVYRALKTGKPKFHSYIFNRQSFPVRSDSSSNGKRSSRIYVKTDSNKITIPSIGDVKISNKDLQKVNFDYPKQNANISFDGKYWYLSFSFEINPVPDSRGTEPLGIDMGIKDTLILSDGTVYPNINKTSLRLKTTQRRLKRLQRKYSRKIELNKRKHPNQPFNRTRNMLKLQKQIVVLHRRLSNIRKSYNHLITSLIVKSRPSKVIIEDLKVKNMMKNKHLSKSIQEQCWYQIREMLNYKCDLYYIPLIIADRFFPSSKTCSSCGSLKSTLKLKDRTYHCNHCNLTIDRDLNASINLRNYQPKAT